MSFDTSVLFHVGQVKLNDMKVGEQNWAIPGGMKSRRGLGGTNLGVDGLSKDKMEPGQA